MTKNFVKPVPAIVRVSKFAGIPDLLDPDPPARQHSFMITLDQDCTGATGVVVHEFFSLPATTPSDFGAFLPRHHQLAYGRKPTMVEAFAGVPAVTKAFPTPKTHSERIPR